MYIDQTCLIQGHEGCKITHICLFVECRISRYICNKCTIDGRHFHDNDCLHQNVEIENFNSYFYDQKLTQMQLRIKSESGNKYKLKYLINIFEEVFYYNDSEEIKNIKHIIQDLIQEYKNELVETQQLNQVYQQLNLNGLQSLNIEQLNILLNNHSEFINKEMELYRRLNIELIEFDMEEKQLQERGQSEIYQKYQIIQKKLRRLNEYLDFQEYSINGEIFETGQEKFMNSSCFSKNDRSFAMFDTIKFEQLKIRKQDTLDIIQQINFKITVKSIKFDPLFKYCVIQDIYYNNQFYFYGLKNNKKSRLIKKFKQKSVYDFYLSNQNNIILFLGHQIVIKALDFKNQLINEIKFQYNKGNYCYGSDQNIIAINYSRYVQIYKETLRRTLILQFAKYQFSDMLFINQDSQLLTMDEQYINIFEMDYKTFNNKQIYKIAKQHDSKYYLINKLEFYIIKETFKSDRGYEIQILDKNFNLWFCFKVSKQLSNELKSLQLTKNFLIMFSVNPISCQIIKRRLITDYEKLEIDCEKLE